MTAALHGEAGNGAVLATVVPVLPASSATLDIVRDTHDSLAGELASPIRAFSHHALR
jgi:hypothetical protein